MVKHLRRTDRGDVPVMTTIVMLLGSAMLVTALAMVGLGEHSMTAVDASMAYDNATSLAQSALDGFYGAIEADPTYFSNGSQWPGADGQWHSFTPNGTIETCADVGGVPGLDTTGGPGCWTVTVSESSAAAAAGAAGPDGPSQSQVAVTATATAMVDCHGAIANCATAQVVQHFKRRDYLDYLYFTNTEATDPLFAGTNLCSSVIQCSEPAYTTGDTVDGPVHTNSPNIWVCGSPSFASVVEATGDPAWEASSAPGCASSNPTFAVAPTADAPVLALPAGDAYLSALAAQASPPWLGQGGYSFSGNITVVLHGTTMDITTSDGTDHSGVAMPSTGVIYASGDVDVSGTNGGQLTLAAGNNVEVDGPLNYSCAPGAAAVPLDCTDYTGLVAGSSVWLDDSGNPLVVDAAMVALAHSVSVNPLDLSLCVSTCPKLTIYGAMASDYRGVFGAYSGLNGLLGEGWAKNFHYDARLYHNSPPWLLSAKTGGWEALPATVVGAPSSAPTTAVVAAPAATTTTAPASTTTTPAATTTTPSGTCTGTEVASGSTGGASTAQTFGITTCAPVPAGDTLLVSVGTFASSPSTSVSDSAGDTYSLVASEPGIYLYGTVAATGIPAGTVISVTGTGPYGMSSVAEAFSGVTLATDGPAYGSYAQPSPFATTFTASTNDVLLLVSAGGTTTATVTPSSMSTYQAISGVSGVFSYMAVPSGAYSVGMTWAQNGTDRSTMVVGLVTTSGSAVTTTTAPTTTTTGQSTVTFGYTGAPATWTVPFGVTSIDATLSGGGGGNAFTNSVTTGGPAGTVSAVLPVNAGEVLDIYVAGQGGFGEPNSAGTFSPGGWGYAIGGEGTTSAASAGMEGGGGGGSSAIATANGPAVVAGGGGGGASTMQTCSSAVWYYWALPPNGPNGTTGQASSGWDRPATGGAGATQSGPGQDSIGGSGGGPGAFGDGGNADVTYNSGGYEDNNTGGGGGAGYYGGAAGMGSPFSCYYGAWQGAMAAGGGGSSWAEATATGVSYGSQSTPANGQVSITYTN